MGEGLGGGSSGVQLVGVEVGGFEAVLGGGECYN